jgi:hypothetical protein
MLAYPVGYISLTTAGHCLVAALTGTCRNVDRRISGALEYVVFTHRAMRCICYAALEGDLGPLCSTSLPSGSHDRYLRHIDDGSPRRPKELSCACTSISTAHAAAAVSVYSFGRSMLLAAFL